MFSGLSLRTQCFILTQAAFCLQALGRTEEAVNPMEKGLKLSVQCEDWLNASIVSSNIADLQILEGHIDEALHAAGMALDYIERLEQSSEGITLGDCSPAFMRVCTRVSLGRAFRLKGRPKEALMLMAEAETIQIKQLKRPIPFLTSIQGYTSLQCAFVLQSQ